MTATASMMHPPPEAFALNLFDVAEADGCDTRNASYHALKAEGTDRTDCDRLLRAYQKYGMLADYQAAAVLGWPVTSVCARRAELMKQHKVARFNTTYNRVTNRTVIVWKAVEG